MGCGFGLIGQSGRPAKGRVLTLRASLASATSLLALLLLEGREAVADPIIRVGTAIPFYYVLGSTWEAGTDAPAAVQSFTFTPLTTGVASTTGGYGGSGANFLAGQSVLAGLNTSNTVTTNTSDADLASVRANRRLGGTVSSGNSVFVGTSANALLLDGPSALPSAASASFGYTMPSSGGVKAPAVLTDDEQSKIVPAIGRDTGSAIARDTVTRDSGAPVYTYTPLGRPAAAGPKPSEATGRVSGAVPGASVFDARGPAAKGSVGPRLPSSAIYDATVKAFSLILQRAASDAKRGDVAQVTLTAGGYTIASGDISSFDVSSQTDGSVVTPGAIVPVPILVVGNGGGELPSSLTIFTAESTALDGGGGSFLYPFD
jgi:hypothetical protein